MLFTLTRTLYTENYKLHVLKYLKEENITEKCTHMRRNEVCDKVEGKTPPDRSKDVTSDLLHPSHYTHAMIHLGEELEQKHHQKY